MSRTVHVVALGARTPIGLTAESAAAAAHAGISRIKFHPLFLDRDGENIRAAADARLEPAVVCWERLGILAGSAIGEVLDKLGRHDSKSGPRQLLVALPEARPGFSEADAQKVLSFLRAAAVQDAWSIDIQLGQRGHAGGLHAFEIGVREIANGSMELCLVAGADSYLDPLTMDWLQGTRQLATKASRAGFTPGEAAGVIVLASDDCRKKLRLRSLGTVRGIATAKETKLIKTEAINLGEGLTEAVNKAAESSRNAGERVSAIYCDINGERYRSEEWGFVCLRTEELLPDHGYVAPADCWGDVGAASGPLLCHLAAQSWARNHARGNLALVFAGSEGGLRGAVVLEAPRGV